MLVLVFAAPASAQEYQTQGEDFDFNVIELPGDNFYIEVRGTDKKGMQPNGGLVDGVYFISNEGEATDCNAEPEGCSELISNAVDGGGETTTSADPPPGSRPAPESLPGGAPDYHYEFQRQRDGTLLFSLDRRVRGLWGYCSEPRLCD